jgi:hypothetical protein
MLWPLNAKYGVSQVYVDQLQVLAQNILDNRIDCLAVFVGLERFGKSTLITRTGRILSDAMGTDFKLQRDYHYELDHYIDELLNTKFSDNEGKLSPKKGGKHYIKVYDEPVLGANSRKWASKGNTMLNQTFAIIGFKYLTMLAGIPNWWMLDPTVRTHRVAFLARVRGKVDDKGYVQKGYFELFNGMALQKIYKDIKSGETVYPYTKFRELRFTSLESENFWKEYEDYSAVSKQKAIKELSDNAKKLAPWNEAKAEEIYEGGKNVE